MSLWNHGPLMFKSSNSTWPGAWWCLTPRKRRRDKIFMGAWWRRDRGEIELYATADQKQAICDCHQELWKLPTQEEVQVNYSKLQVAARQPAVMLSFVTSHHYALATVRYDCGAMIVLAVDFRLSLLPSS